MIPSRNFSDSTLNCKNFLRRDKETSLSPDSFSIFTLFKFLIGKQENPIKIDGLHQTIYHALGISPDTNYDVEKRPFYTTPDGKGKAVMDLFS